MIKTLAITILIETPLVILFAVWKRKPLKHLLFSSVVANLITQFILWAVLIEYPYHYLLTLCLCEVLIWGIEASILYLYCFNQLALKEALLLSLVMNLASFGIGWLLPV